MPRSTGLCRRGYGYADNAFISTTSANGCHYFHLYTYTYGMYGHSETSLLRTPARQSKIDRNDEATVLSILIYDTLTVT